MLYDRFFNREYRLIVKQKGKTIFESHTLDMKFTVDRYHSFSACRSRISVLGLSRDTISRIAKIARACFAEAMEMEITVELHAGYKGNCPLIYKGYVLSAHVDSPPNMWLHMECVNYTELGETPKPVSIFTGPNMRITNIDIANMIFRKMGMPVPDMSGYHPKGDDYAKGNISIYGMFTKAEAMSELNKINSDNWIVFYDMGRVYICDNIPDENKSKRIFLNKDNGLLSASGVTFTKCKATVLMQDCDPTTMIAEVVSEYNIGANGIWTILGRKHEGHFRGNLWQTTYNLYQRRQLQ